MILPKPGDRIRLIAMPDDPDPVPPDSTGTVIFVEKHDTDPRTWFQVDVNWDNGRKLMLAIPPDRIEIIAGDQEN